ncbi:MAG: hypothetical protein ABIO02_00135, partial [Patescibacteria group bacterium]
SYLIAVTRTPWNVSPVFGVSSLIFLCIYQIVQKKEYNYIPWLAFLTGLFFHLHFSIVFIIPIILASFILLKEKKKVLIIGLKSLPLFLIWFIPTLIFDMRAGSDSSSHLFNNFIKDYVVSAFHPKLMVKRFNDAFVQFQTVLSFSPALFFLRYIPLTIFGFVAYFEKDKKKRTLTFLMALWFIVPAVVYPLYTGVTSEYYVLINAPIVIFILIYLQEKLLKKFEYKKAVIVLLLIIWAYYAYRNTNNLWVKRSYGGLHEQKDTTRKYMKWGMGLEYNEGDIHTYLKKIWTEKR